MSMRGFTRRIASNGVSLDGKELGRYVVELRDDEVIDYYPLLSELPFTEWIPTSVKLVREKGRIIWLV